MTTDSTPPADDQAARYEAELSRWAEKNVELAAENIDLRARVAVVRALRDKYAVENAQLQQARRNRIGVYGHNDAYALVAHVVSELDAVLDGPAEAAEPATFQERAERFGREFAAGMAEGIGASEAAEPAATPNQLQAAPTLGVAEAGAPEPAADRCGCCEIVWRLCRGLYDKGYARCCSDCTHDLDVRPGSVSTTPDPAAQERLARWLYRNYGGNTTKNGDWHQPPWSELTDVIRAAWITESGDALAALAGSATPPEETT